MDYSRFMAELEDASLFDLYRLKVAICKELDDPKRTEAVRRLIQAGETVSYFDSRENRLVQAEVIEIRRTRVVVRDQHDAQQWIIPFYMINAAKVATDIVPSTSPRGMSRNEVRIGDQVGFKSRTGRNVHGKVVRLNPKTVTVSVEPNEKWRVPYSMLCPVIDGAKASGRRFIEGVVVERDSTGIVNGSEGDEESQ
jgi:hypothetical protein